MRVVIELDMWGLMGLGLEGGYTLAKGKSNTPFLQP